MKKVNGITSFAILAITLIGMSSCGESFTGRFAGNGSFDPNNCSNLQRIGNANIELRLTISGGEAEILILNVEDAATGQMVSGLRLAGLQRDVSLSNDTQLEGERANDAPEEFELNALYPIYHTISGNVATDRSVIDNLNLRIDTVDASHPPEDPCSITITATRLQFID